MFSRFSAERENKIVACARLGGAVILGVSFGNAAVSATRGVATYFRYYVPALPLWYRLFFVVGGLALAARVRNVPLRAAFLVFAVDQVFRMSLSGLPIGAVIYAVLLMMAGFTLNTRESWWTRPPALVTIAVVLASATLTFAIQTYALRAFDRASGR